MATSNPRRADGPDAPAAEPTGLRERKKARTRRHIAATAAHLFGERGYENVSVSDVAVAAEVAVQTLYNYFPAKQDLVLDRDEEIRERLVEVVTNRAAGTNPAQALRPFVDQELRAHRARTTGQARGELPVLCATSATVRRLTLEARDRQAEALAGAIAATCPGLGPVTARAHAAALVAILQTITDHVGRRFLAGATADRIVDEIAPEVEAALDDLARRFAV